MRKVAMVAALTLAFFALCACSSVTPKVETVYVKVPVPVSCVKEVPKKPIFAVGLINDSDELFKITDAYMVDRHQRRIYEKQLESVIAGCVK